MRKSIKIILVLFILLAGWILVDINYPLKRNIRIINAEETARLDGAMWKSYYEKKPVKLLMQSAELMRTQFHFPLWHSMRVAYFAAKAAFVFKEGTTRASYEKALPYLVKYFKHISDISKEPFNADTAAKQELEWWIIRRSRNEHPPAEWKRYLAATGSTMYHLPAEKFIDYAHLRVQAMLLRDAKDSSITEADWWQINSLLADAWRHFSETLSTNSSK